MPEPERTTPDPSESDAPDSMKQADRANGEGDGIDEPDENDDDSVVADADQAK